MPLTRIVLFLFAAALIASCEGDASVDSSTTGQGGSMTRFAIHNGYLYVVDQQVLNVYDTRNNTFKKVGDVAVGNGLETIFAGGDHLYLGANDAMYIFSLSNPELPAFVFRYSHVVSCDPVVVQGNRAYVTLRNGSFCNRGSNALEIIDISNPNDPQLISNFPMASPHGLAVSDNLLFLCDGTNGFKVYDIANEHDIKLVQQVTNIHAYDVIEWNGILIVTGEDGVFQYQYNPGPGTLEAISSIPVTRSDV